MLSLLFCLDSKRSILCLAENAHAFYTCTRYTHSVAHTEIKLSKSNVAERNGINTAKQTWEEEEKNTRRNTAYRQILLFSPKMRAQRTDKNVERNIIEEKKWTDCSMARTLKVKKCLGVDEPKIIPCWWTYSLTRFDSMRFIWRLTIVLSCL